MGVLIIRALFSNNIVRWFLREREGAGGLSLEILNRASWVELGIYLTRQCC